MPFQDLIRLGNEHGVLLGDWPAWRRYRDLWVRASHTYVAAAMVVVAGIPDFLKEAAHLFDALTARLS